MPAFLSYSERHRSLQHLSSARVKRNEMRIFHFRECFRNMPRQQCCEMDVRKNASTWWPARHDYHDSPFSSGICKITCFICPVCHMKCNLPRAWASRLSTRDGRTSSLSCLLRCIYMCIYIYIHMCIYILCTCIFCFYHAVSPFHFHPTAFALL